MKTIKKQSMKKRSKSRFYTVKQPKLKHFDCKQKIVDNALRDMAEDFKKQEVRVKYNYPPPYPGAPLTENGQKEFEARGQAAKDKGINIDYSAATFTLAETKNTNAPIPTAQDYARASEYMSCLNTFQFILKTLLNEFGSTGDLITMYKLALAIAAARVAYNYSKPVASTETVGQMSPISYTVTTT